MRLKDLAPAVGKRIKGLRKVQGLTQAELAIKAGLMTKYVSEVETGRRDVRLSTLGRLARSLGVAPAELFRVGEEDVTIAQVETLLKTRDEVFRGQLLKVLRDVLLLADAGRSS